MRCPYATCPASFAGDLELYGPRGPQPEPPSLGRRAGGIAGDWRGGTTRISPSPAACSRGACGSISTISTPIAAGPTIWPTRAATRERSLALLDWWEKQLTPATAGEAIHPVFIALADTIRQFDIPPDPFVDLAGRLPPGPAGARVTRTFGQLLDYCRYSANPVGRLVLYLGRCCTPERVRLSDCDLHRAATGQLLPGCGRAIGTAAAFICRWPIAAASATTKRCSPAASATTPSAGCWRPRWTRPKAGCAADCRWPR